MPEFPLLRMLPTGEFVEITGDASFLGRDCHLVAFLPALLNKVVSNRHCVVRRESEGRWMLEDLGSTNGTWIRGARLNGKALLHTGDTFSLGRGGPAFECHRGFGGTGPNATMAEPASGGGPPDAAAAAADARTLLDASLAARTAMAPHAKAPAPARPAPGGADGTADHPYRAGAAPSMHVRHERTGQEFTASGYTIVVGRDPSVQVVIRSDEEKHVSGQHCEVQFRSDGSVVVRDLASRNGTWLNDRRLKDEAAVLKVGDRLLLGTVATILLVKRLVAGEGPVPR